MGSENPNRNERIFSNKMADCCTHKCRLCEKIVTLTAMRIHTRNMHGITSSEYVAKFGNYRELMERETWHKCGLCGEEVLLDSDSLHKNALKHKMSMKEYSSQFTIPVNPNLPKDTKDKDQQSTSVVRKPPKQQQKQVPEEVVPKKGAWELMSNIEAILDSFNRSSR